ncbi:MAG: DUF2179 domain-containing protein [Candidatus Aminicenantaceae bacterium]
METVFDFSFYTWVIIPIMIFFARVLDVSLGTIRIVFISKGIKFLSALVGFFEILVWLLALRQIMKNLDNPVCFLAYAIGFAMGNFFGILIEDKIAIGRLIISIFSKKNTKALVEEFKGKGFGVTVFEGQGSQGKVRIIYLTIRRKDRKKVIQAINQFNPKAFYSIEEARSVNEGVFPYRDRKKYRWKKMLPRLIRKGK